MEIRPIMNLKEDELILPAQRYNDLQYESTLSTAGMGVVWFKNGAETNYLYNGNVINHYIKKGIFSKKPIVDNSNYIFYFYNQGLQVGSWGGNVDYEDRQIHSGFATKVFIIVDFQYKIINPVALIDNGIFTKQDADEKLFRGAFPVFSRTWLSRMLKQSGTINVHQYEEILKENILDLVNKNLQDIGAGIVIQNLDLLINQDPINREKKNKILFEDFIKSIR